MKPRNQNTFAFHNNASFHLTEGLSPKHKSTTVKPIAVASLWSWPPLMYIWHQAPKIGVDTENKTLFFMSTTTTGNDDSL